jgi:hypothetical protein
MSGQDQRSEVEFEHRLAAWFVDEAPSHARPGLLDEVLDQTRVTRQLDRHAWWPRVAWPRLRLQGRMRAALVSVLVVVVGTGVVLVGSRVADQGTFAGATRSAAPSAVPVSPSPATPGPSPRPAWLRDAGSAALEPGVSFYFDLPVPVTFSVPAGWSFASTGQTGSVIVNDQQTAAVGWFAADNVFRDPCRWLKGLLDPPVGPSVDDQVKALEKLPGFVVAGPTPAQIGGLAARSLVLTPTVSQSACDGSQVKIWAWTPTGRQQDLFGGTATVRVMNVGGTPLLVISWTSLPDTAGAAADVAAIVRSIQFR